MKKMAVMATVSKIYFELLLKGNLTRKMAWIIEVEQKKLKSEIQESFEIESWYIIGTVTSTKLVHIQIDTRLNSAFTAGAKLLYIYNILF